VFVSWSGVPTILPNVGVRLEESPRHFMYIHTAQSWSHAPLPSNAWNHIVFVFDGTAEPAKNRVRYYVNGHALELISPGGGMYPTNLAIPTEGTKTVIGAAVSYYGGYPQNFFQGSIDDVRLYLEAFKPSEIRTLFAVESRPLPQLWIQPPPELLLTLVGVDGTQYQLQSSKDLAQWDDEGTAFLSTSSVLTIQVPSDGPQRFWRAQILP
jgi:hypothetical protein